MELNFRVINGYNFSVPNLSGSMTVAELKTMLSNNKKNALGDFPPDRLRLAISYTDRPPKGLDLNKFESSTLDELDIKNGDTIHIIFMLGRKEGSSRKSRRSNRRNNRKSRRNKTRR